MIKLEANGCEVHREVNGTLIDLLCELYWCCDSVIERISMDVKYSKSDLMRTFATGLIEYHDAHRDCDWVLPDKEEG